MEIKVAKSAGFCFGVKEAVKTAEEMLRAGQKVDMLGEIVHNQDVVSELCEAGSTLYKELSDVPEKAQVIIRAHGVPPQTIEHLQKCQCQIVDKTCPYVSKIHKLADQADKEGKDVIIVGNPKHPEIIGIAGYVRRQNCYIVNNLEEAKILVEQLENDDKLDREYILLAQTTFEQDKFTQIKEIIKNKVVTLVVFDTICYTTKYRQNEAIELAKNSDIVFVIGGEHSSNTAKLAEVASKHCRETYLIQRPAQVAEIIGSRDLTNLHIGITAGASTPERMIREVIQVMSEQDLRNQQTEEQTAVNEVAEENQVSNETIATETVEVLTPEDVVGTEEKEVKEEPVSDDIDFSEFIDSIPQLKRGSTVKGRIVRYDDDFVYVDVKDKTEGRINRREFVSDSTFDLDQAVANQQTIDVYVRNIRNNEHDKEILLSKARVDFSKHKEAIEKAYKEQTPVQVKVVNTVKDGVIASFGSVDLYIHRTQLELQIVEDLEQYVGQTLEVMITQFDNQGKKLRVSGSRRALLQKARHERSRQVWDSIEIGKEYEGVVRNLTDFGAFIDLDGVDGLVHISELSWDRIKHPSEVVSVGDHLSVFVKDFDREKKRISLGFRRPENDPYYMVEERFPVGSIVRGVVVRMLPFGAFVEIAPGVDALCHISQISTYRLNRPSDVLKEGMEVDARVLEVSNAERKVSISIKEVEPINPERPEPSEQTEKKVNKKPRRQRQKNEPDKLPTTYVDQESGSTLSSLANFTFSDEESAEALGLINHEEKHEEVVEEVTTDTTEVNVKAPVSDLELLKEETVEATQAEAVVDEAEVAEEAPVTGEDGDATVEQGHSL